MSALTPQTRAVFHRHSALVSFCFPMKKPPRMRERCRGMGRIIHSVTPYDRVEHHTVKGPAEIDNVRLSEALRCRRVGSPARPLVGHG